MKRLIAPLALTALVACGSPAPAPSPTPTAAATPDKPKTLVPSDLGQLRLGARIEGPQGPEVTSTIASDGQQLATLVSYVACPEGIDPCDPAALPEGTVYTYVHEVTPAEGVSSAGLFRTSRAVGGFSGAIGLDREQAKAVLGDKGAIDVSSDNGALVWRVIGGDGWSAGETLTFYWQSALPPEGPREAYQVEADGLSAIGTGPFPPREAPAPSTSTSSAPAR